ncbi:hypothetical protein HU200_037408 [Digitaria exilis]|uniref:Protein DETOXIFICATION n=1 Tax=Digitaria exilis TaxID=1010633 RepID=A0A835BFG2_9POAL|nr:hypothetical protein HU200_037408 [Digitaria exilis]
MGEEAAAPLLGDLHGDAADGNNRKEKEEELPAPTRSSRTDSRRSIPGCWDWEETAGQLAFAAPMVATSMAYYAIPLVSVMYAGRLGDLQFAAATLGNSWGTVTGIALMTGLSGSLETLCGQRYGAKAYRMMGVYLQASLLTSALFSVVVSLLWFYSEPVLVFLRQDPEVSRLAGVFLRYSIPAQFAYGFIQCTLRFLQAQSVVMPLVALSLLPLAVHVGINHALVNCLGFGFAGAAMATSVSMWLSFLLLLAYVAFSDAFRDTWGGFTAEAFRHVLPGMKLAVPSAVMVCFEYWSFEILVLLAGLMPESQLSTSIIAMWYAFSLPFPSLMQCDLFNEPNISDHTNAIGSENTEAISYMITYGFAAVISTRVSNELGARNIAKAKKALGVSMALSLALGVAFLLLLGLGHDGLWLGQICGLLCQNCVLLFITLRTDWEKLDLTTVDKDNDFVC